MPVIFCTPYQNISYGTVPLRTFSTASSMGPYDYAILLKGKNLDLYPFISMAFTVDMIGKNLDLYPFVSMAFTVDMIGKNLDLYPFITTAFSPTMIGSVAILYTLIGGRTNLSSTSSGTIGMLPFIGGVATLSSTSSSAA